MANLKICYELTPTELKTTDICPHCHYNLGDQVPNVAGQLDNLDIRIDDLVTEWTQTLLNTISDPIVASQKDAGQDSERSSTVCMDSDRGEKRKSSFQLNGRSESMGRC